MKRHFSMKKFEQTCKFGHLLYESITWSGNVALQYFCDTFLQVLYPEKIYQFISKLTMKNRNYINDAILVSLLITLNLFQTFFRLEQIACSMPIWRVTSAVSRKDLPIHFKVNNEEPELHQWRYSCFFVDNFELISDLF